MKRIVTCLGRMQEAVETMTAPELPTCEVCGREGKAARACRFEKACSCWYGVPCDPAGASYRQMTGKAGDGRDIGKVAR